MKKIITYTHTQRDIHKEREIFYKEFEKQICDIRERLMKEIITSTNS